MSLHGDGASLERAIGIGFRAAFLADHDDRSHRDLAVRCFSTLESSRRHVLPALDALYHRWMKPHINIHPIMSVLRNTIRRSKMRSAMRTAARPGTKHVIDRADTSIFLRGSESQPGLLRALDLAPHGQSHDPCGVKIPFPCWGEDFRF